MLWGIEGGAPLYFPVAVLVVATVEKALVWVSKTAISSLRLYFVFACLAFALLQALLCLCMSCFFVSLGVLGALLGSFGGSLGSLRGSEGHI